MKKITFLLALAFTFCLSEVKAQVWPYGSATAITIPASAGTLAVTASNNMLYVSSVPTITANLTVSVTASSQLKAGAILHLAVATSGTETTVFTGAIQSTTVTGVAGKTWTQGFIYNGTKYYPMGAKIQID